MAKFVLTVQDVFTIKGRGIVVTGIVENAGIKVGDLAELISADISTVIQTSIAGMEKFVGMLDGRPNIAPSQEAVAGDNVGVLLANQELTKDNVKAGCVLRGM